MRCRSIYRLLIDGELVAGASTRQSDGRPRGLSDFREPLDKLILAKIAKPTESKLVKGPAESGEILFGGSRRKIAKKIANHRPS
jgi:hypothetical protein